MDEDTLPCADRFLPRGEFWLISLGRQGAVGRPCRRSQGTGIVSVMRRGARTAARPFLRPNAAHNATLCLGPLLRLFPGAPSGGFILRGRPRLERVRRTRTRSAPQHNALDYAQRSGGSAVRLRPHNSRYVQVPPASGFGSASGAPRCSFAGCVASCISLSLSIETRV